MEKMKLGVKLLAQAQEKKIGDTMFVHDINRVLHATVARDLKDKAPASPYKYAYQEAMKTILVKEPPAKKGSHSYLWKVTGAHEPTDGCIEAMGSKKVEEQVERVLAIIYPSMPE